MCWENWSENKKIICLLANFFCCGLNRISGLSKSRNCCVYMKLLFHISFSFHPCSYCEPIPCTPNYLVFPQDSCSLQRHVFKCILSISSPWEMTHPSPPLPVNLSQFGPGNESFKWFPPLMMKHAWQLWQVINWDGGTGSTFRLALRMSAVLC